MRQQKAGRIINISSVAGKFFTPANGTYSATKFALEALSDALRLELTPFNIQVVLIEPGSIKTQFHATVEANAKEIFGDPRSPYRPLYQHYEAVTADMRRAEPGPDVVSQAVQIAIEAPRPKARYMVAFSFAGRLLLHLGDPVWDSVVRRMFKIQAAALPG
jgi:short-subunit dehydrogenase